MLAADLEGYTTAFLKFDLSSIAGKTLTGVTLRIHTSTESWATVNSRVNVKSVYDTGWYEQWMTFNNTVAVSPTILGWLNLATATDTWYDVPLYPSLVQPYVGHLTSMALQGTASDLLIFDSRESGANAPQLVLSYK